MEIPTVENHRIDVLRDFFTFYSIFAVTAALAATASLLGRSGGILKEKLIPFLKSPPLKTIELMYHMIFLLVFSIFVVTVAPAATVAPLGRSGGYLKEKLIPFLKSPPFKTIELMYHMIFYMFFSIFAVTAAQAATAAPLGGSGVS